jgi:lipid-binding SYLF domain-containing protein
VEDARRATSSAAVSKLQRPTLGDNPMSKSHFLVLLLTSGACATNKPSPAKTDELITKAHMTINEMQRTDPSISDMLANSAGYVVFPDVGAGGAVVGGAFGRGILFEHGQPTGYIELRQASVGLALGGQTYSELIVLRAPNNVEDVKAGAFKMGAGASAVALKSGVAAAGQFTGDVAIFVHSKGGLMAGVSIGGQRFGYRPLG